MGAFFISSTNLGDDLPSMKEVPNEDNHCITDQWDERVPYQL
jgi:hypothetical protein